MVVNVYSWDAALTKPNCTINLRTSCIALVALTDFILDVVLDNLVSGDNSAIHIQNWRIFSG